MATPFGSDLVFEEKISEATLRAYHVGFEQNKFRLKPLVDVIIKVIPEFAFGYHEGKNVGLPNIIDKIRDAAILIYDTDKFKNRGEFGELILHLLLRDFCGTIPLLSKIYFKSARNDTVKGFDGVHIQNTKSKKLWLGESKLYSDGVSGVKSLANDVKEHLKEDYLRREFSLISKSGKIPKTIPNRDYWIRLLHEHQTLEKIFSTICVPCVCTYSSDIFKSHKEATEKYLEDFKKECSSLKKEFYSQEIKTNVEVILMLLPIPSKEELVKELHTRLKHAQSI